MMAAPFDGVVPVMITPKPFGPLSVAADTSMYEPAAGAPVGSRRAVPPVAAPSANVPLLPSLSRQVP